MLCCFQNLELIVSFQELLKHEHDDVNYVLTQWIQCTTVHLIEVPCQILAVSFLSCC